MSEENDEKFYYNKAGDAAEKRTPDSETDYLLSNEANAAWLSKSKKQLLDGNTFEIHLPEGAPLPEDLIREDRDR